MGYEFETPDPVSAMLMRELAREIERSVPEGAAFAVFIDWKDGKGLSYASNTTRPSVVTALAEWLAKREGGAPLERGYRGEIPTLETECVRLGKWMEEEDIRVLLFFFTIGDHGITAWYTSLPDARAVVRAFVEKHA